MWIHKITPLDTLWAWHWLGVVLFVTMVVSVCSVSGGIGFASGFVRFHSDRLPPIGCGLRCWGVWIQVLPVSVKYTGPLVTWKVIWWRSTEGVGRTIMIGLLGSETGVVVGFPMRRLSSNRGWSEKFRILLGHRCWYVFHGECWCFLFVAFGCFWGINVCSHHDLEKNSTQGVEFKYTVRDVPNRWR